MTDDTTSITTVSDDEIGSWEDRYERGSALALSHPPPTPHFFGVSLRHPKLSRLLRDMCAVRR